MIASWILISSVIGIMLLGIYAGRRMYLDDRQRAVVEHQAREAFEREFPIVTSHDLDELTHEQIKAIQPRSLRR